MTETVERIAEVLYKRHINGPDSWIDQADWSRASEDEKAHWRAIAKDAVAAFSALLPPEGEGTGDEDYEYGWNSCLDEIKTRLRK